jgi:hypothetical protein
LGGFLVWISRNSLLQYTAEGSYDWREKCWDSCRIAVGDYVIMIGNFILGAALGRL